MFWRKNKEIEELQDKVRELRNDIEMIHVKDCPNCGHKTMMFQPSIPNDWIIPYDERMSYYNYTCLTCGNVYINRTKLELLEKEE